MSDALSKAEHFQREYRDRLSPDQQKPLQKSIDDLRSNYETAKKKSADWMTESSQTLDRLKQEEEERVGEINIIIFMLIHRAAYSLFVLPYNYSFFNKMNIYR